jgi:hypothetical protein
MFYELLFIRQKVQEEGVYDERTVRKLRAR